MTRVERGYRDHIPRWSEPHVLFTCMTALSVGSAFLVPETVYRRNWRVGKFVDVDTLGYALLVSAVFLAGYLIVRPLPDRLRSLDTPKNHVVRTLLILAVGGNGLLFIVNFWSGALSLAEIGGIFTGQDGLASDVRLESRQIPGLTTLSQLGLPAIALWASTEVSRSRSRYLVAALVGLAAVRSVVFSERLALIELVVGAAVVLIRSGRFRDGNRRVRRAIRYLPIPALALLLLTFTAYETTRSWSFYSQTGQYDSPLQFGSYRLLAYYTTSVNNGELLADELDAPPYFTVEWLWNSPGSGTALGLDEREVVSDFRRVLETKGTLEFNNAGGLRAPYQDFGLGGSLLWWLSFGVASGLAFRGWQRGRLHAVVLYPVLMLTLFDSPRFIYASLGRAVPALLVASMLAALGSRAVSRTVSPRQLRSGAPDPGAEDSPARSSLQT